jgi:F0F1-type ATP synthase assembly protein I
MIDFAIGFIVGFISGFVVGFVIGFIVGFLADFEANFTDGFIVGMIVGCFAGFIAGCLSYYAPNLDVEKNEDIENNQNIEKNEDIENNRILIPSSANFNPYYWTLNQPQDNNNSRFWNYSILTPFQDNRDEQFWNNLILCNPIGNQVDLSYHINIEPYTFDLVQAEKMRNIYDEQFSHRLFRELNI